jgi:hypothetical protein
VIRYRFPGLGLDPQTASLCKHPTLARLRIAGPWRAGRNGAGDILLTQVIAGQPDATDWRAEEPGLDGCFFQLAAGADAGRLRVTPHPQAALVPLACGLRWPVLPSYLCPVAIGIDCKPRGVVGEYGRLADQVLERASVGAATLDEPAVIDLVRLALASCCPALTPELAHALGMITTADVQTVLEAVWYPPKLAAAAQPSR